MCLVSFIVPVYNLKREELNECINSIINQTNKDFEVIIVDDGSNNGIEKFCDEISKYDQIVVIHQENRGLASARNAGTARATGEWIVHVDGDDWVDLNLVQTIYQDIIPDHVDIIVWGYVHYSKKISITYLLDNKNAFECDYETIKEKVLCSILDYDASFSSLALNTSWGKAYRRQFIQNNNLKYDIKLRRAQDAAYNLYAFSSAKVVKYIDAAYSYYRSDNISLSRGYSPNSLEYLTTTALAVMEFANTSDNFIRVKDATNVFIQRCFRMINEQYFQHRDNPMTYAERKQLFLQTINKEPYYSAFSSNVKRLRLLDRIADVLYKYHFFFLIPIFNVIRSYARNMKTSNLK